MITIFKKIWYNFVILCFIQNPAFGPAQVRKFTSLFLEKSLEVSTSERSSGLSIQHQQFCSFAKFGPTFFQNQHEKMENWHLIPSPG